MSDPAAALERLAELLAAERTLISAEPRPPAGEGPALGELAAAGPRSAAAPGEYALLVETIREGYLLHYGRPRLLRSEDPDLALLAGDYLYARGLERLAALGDLEAVAELADLISLAALLHAGDEAATHAAALWLAAVTAVGCGASPAHRRAKAVLREGRPDAAGLLWSAATATARDAGAGNALERAAEAIGFRVPS